MGVAHRLGQAASDGLLGLRVRRPLGRGPVAGGGHGHPVGGLHRARGLAGPVEVVAGEDPPAVLPGQGGHHVHVVVGVPDRDPAHPQVVAAGGQPDPVQVGLGDVPPGLVGLVRMPERLM